MFERFNETARRAIFFGRLAVEEHGEAAMAPRHLLAGLLRAAPSTVLSGLRPGSTVEEIVRRLDPLFPKDPVLGVTPDVRFDAQLQIVLERAESEANGLGDDKIRPEHLLLALFVQQGTHVDLVLREFGFRRDLIEKALPERRHSDPCA